MTETTFRKQLKELGFVQRGKAEKNTWRFYRAPDGSFEFSYMVYAPKSTARKDISFSIAYYHDGFNPNIFAHDIEDYPNIGKTADGLWQVSFLRKEGWSRWTIPADATATPSV